MLFSFASITAAADFLEESLELETDTVVISPNQMVCVDIYCVDYNWDTIDCDVADKKIIEVETKTIDKYTTELYVYGCSVGETTIKVSLINKSKVVIGEKYIMVNCVESTVNLDDVTIDFGKETSKTVSVGFTGGIPSEVSVELNNFDKSVVDLQLGKFENNAQQVTIVALKEGKTSVLVEFFDKNTNKVFASKEIAINVHKHTIVVKNAKKATYLAMGYSGDSVCESCNAVVEKGQQLPKLVLKTPKFKLTSGKAQFKVKYTKVAGATGFEVRYKLKGAWKTKTFNTKKTATKVIKKLSAGAYKVQVRAFVKQGGKKTFSAWSKTQNVKVK